jgi:hypothetical protein
MEHGLPIAPKALRLALLLLAAAALALPACSSSMTPSCTTAGCPKGDACIDDGSGIGARCLRACTSQSQCAAGTFCNDGQPQSWCARSTLELTLGAGQWGTPCSPTRGMNNPACDTGDNFFCYGASPTDATAFCTYFDCVYDSDCPGGWCAVVNDEPNVDTATRSFGATQSVCLPRQYCAPCRLDHDCSLSPDGSQEHCVGQTSPGGGFCAPQCATSSDCRLDATCTPQTGVCTANACGSDADCQANGSAQVCIAGACALACAADTDCPMANGEPQRCAPGISGVSVCTAQACNSDDDCPPTLGTFQHCNAGACTPECGANSDCDPGADDQTCVALSVCTPRAGACVGDGSFCTACRSDADCADGYCVASTYSKERFCSQTVANGNCSPTTGPPTNGCPSLPAGASAKMVACTAAVSDFAPANQCIGEVTFGTAQGMTQFDPGCWAQNR